MTSPSSPTPDHASSSGFRQKLPPERIALLREWVECTTRSFKKIGQELGISPATISRYAKEGGWKRPAGAAPPPPAIVRRNPAPASRRNDAPPSAPAPRRRPVPSTHAREHLVERLWSLAERHAESLETQPIERTERSLQPLARLTRTLGEIDKHVRPPLPAHEYEADYEIDAPKPRRTLHELRDELAAHLERINREEGDGWEVREWWFKDGAGI